MSRHLNPDPVDVLLTQGWGKSAYNVVRSLGRHGLSVAVGTDKFSSMAVYSRYAASSFHHSFPIAQTPEFISEVRQALNRHRPKVYLPLAEDTYIVSKYIEHLRGSGAIIPIAPFHTIRTLHKKDALARLAESLGIPTPRTVAARTESDVRHCLRDFGAPIVLKRISSSGARGVFYLHSDDDISKVLDRRAKEADEPLSAFVVQQYVAGGGYGVSALFNEGRLRATFTHKRLREKTRTGGISTLRVGAAVPRIEEYAHHLLESVRFHGVAMVEFRYDERTGRCWLLEVNPRFWGSLALAVQSGVDFPYLLYRMATEGDVEPVTTYRIGRVVRWLLGDIGALIARLGQRGSMSSIKGIRRPWASGYDDLYFDDPLPFAVSPILSLRKAIGTMAWRADELDLNIDQLDRTRVR
jgi:predicted ATP-grasp superfamily ATP-dependent carboligase